MSEQPEFNEHQIAYFQAKNWGHLATIRKDGSAHVSPMWIDWDGSHLLLNMATDSVKYKHIRRNPQITVEVCDQVDPQLGYVEVTGEAILVSEGADEHIDSLAKKYLDIDRYQWRGPEEERVIVKVAPTKIFARGGAVGGPPRALADD